MPVRRGSEGEFCAVQATPEVPMRKLLRIDRGESDWASAGPEARTKASVPSAAPANDLPFKFVMVTEYLPARWLR